MDITIVSEVRAAIGANKLAHADAAAILSDPAHELYIDVAHHVAGYRKAAARERVYSQVRLPRLPDLARVTDPELAEAVKVARGAVAKLTTGARRSMAQGDAAAILALAAAVEG
jgi:hypothetical protein